MELQKIYSTLTVSNLGRAEDWYTRLLGREPDYRPMDTLVLWNLSPAGGIELSTDDNLGKGTGSVFFEVADVAVERERLNEVGIALGQDIEADYSTLAQVDDPDGNLITLGTPPSREYPKA